MLLAGVILVFLLVFCFFVLLFDAFFGGLDFASNRKAVITVIKIIKDYNLENGNFYDLGSARGGFAVKIAKALPRMNITGIDNNRLRVFLAKARSLLIKNLNFKKENIFKVNVLSANIIYIYLPQELMPDLETKLRQELKLGAMVITNKVSFTNWPSTQKFNNLFIYVKS